MLEFQNKKKIFSVQVLLATHNGEKYLREFLESLVTQTGVIIELLVSDDNSTDGTIEILKMYEEKFASLSVFNGPEQGPARNFFSLLQKANSDYVALADQDDIWNLVNYMRSLKK